MSALKFKVGDVVVDALGIIGAIIGVYPGSPFPYSIREVDGTSARHAESWKMHIAPTEPTGDGTGASGGAEGVRGRGGANEGADEAHSDPVNHPSHYTSSPAKCSECGAGIECIQITEHMGFNLGSATKYLWRCDLKLDAIEDLKKSIWYIQREIQKRERA